MLNLIDESTGVIFPMRLPKISLKFTSQHGCVYLNSYISTYTVMSMAKYTERENKLSNRTICNDNFLGHPKDFFHAAGDAAGTANAFMEL